MNGTANFLTAFARSGRCRLRPLLKGEYVRTVRDFVPKSIRVEQSLGMFGGSEISVAFSIEDSVTADAILYAVRDNQLEGKLLFGCIREITCLDGPVLPKIVVQGIKSVFVRGTKTLEVTFIAENVVDFPVGVVGVWLDVENPSLFIRIYSDI